jgi:hypothetical protein
VQHGGPQKLNFVFGQAKVGALQELKNGHSIEFLGIGGEAISENDVRLFGRLPNLKRALLSGSMTAQAVRLFDEFSKETSLIIDMPIESREQFEAIVQSRRIKQLKVTNKVFESHWFDGSTTNQSITRLQMSGAAFGSLPISRFNAVDSIQLFDSPLGLFELNRLAESGVDQIELLHVVPNDDEIVQFDWTRLSERKLTISAKRGFSEISLTQILSQCTPSKVFFDTNSLTFEEFLRMRERCPNVVNYWIPMTWQNQLPPKKPIANTPPEPAP